MTAVKNADSYGYQIMKDMKPYIRSVTGNVTGTLLTPKVIAAQVTTGSVDVPKFTTGGRCEITITTGNISTEIP